MYLSASVRWCLEIVYFQHRKRRWFRSSRRLGSGGIWGIRFGGSCVGVCLVQCVLCAFGLPAVEALCGLYEARVRKLGIDVLDRSDCFHHFLLSCFVFHRVAVRLPIGRFLRRNLGRCWSLELNSAASLASPSADSLPSESMCPATHVKVIVRLGFARAPCEVS